MLIKVHRICSLEEAELFESLGADLIGISMSEDAHFEDHRTVEVNVALNLAKNIKHAQLVLEPPQDMSGCNLVRLAKQMDAKWIQTPFFAAPESSVRKALANTGIGIILSRLEADYDMDPNWVLGPARDLGDPFPDLVEVEIIPSFKDSWRFLTEESPQRNDELQVEDLESLARTAPLLLSIDFTSDNIMMIQATIPSARGLSFTLGSLAAGVSRLHVMDPDDAAKLLNIVK